MREVIQKERTLTNIMLISLLTNVRGHFPIYLSVDVTASLLVNSKSLVHNHVRGSIAALKLTLRTTLCHPESLTRAPLLTRLSRSPSAHPSASSLASFSSPSESYVSPKRNSLISSKKCSYDQSVVELENVVVVIQHDSVSCILGHGIFETMR